jgi:hypothetical protein
MKRNGHVWCIVLVLTLAVAMAGCQTIPEEHKGAAVGAGAGAATGAVAGAVLGDTKGAVVGGLVGALVGGAIGHYGYDQQRSREATEEVYNYEEGYGTMLSIEDAVVTPEYVYPGDTVDIEVTYALLNPRGVTPVHEIRRITHEGRLVGKPEVTVDRSAGTYNSTIPLRLPETAARGIYEVTTIVESDTARDTRRITFRVR